MERTCATGRNELITETDCTAPLHAASIVRDRRLPPIVWPLGLLIVASLLVNAFNLDQQVAAVFYGTDGVWKYRENNWVQFSYHYGAWPTIAASAVCGLIYLGSLVHRSLKPASRLSAFLALLLILGPGLIINAGFKEQFGRPRPVQIERFGGDLEFVPALKPRWGERGRSFPSGHASMGFFWMGLFVYWRSQRPKWAWRALAAGLVYGTIMGLGRMMQGGHWLSDVLWSGGLIYLTAWLLVRCGLQAQPQYRNAEDE